MTKVRYQHHKKYLKRLNDTAVIRVQVDRKKQGSSGRIPRGGNRAWGTGVGFPEGPCPLSRKYL